MSLRDSSCYTLTLAPNKEDLNRTDLFESYGPPVTGAAAGSVEPRYVRVKERTEDEAYSSVVFDGLTAAKLASTGYTTEKAKKRRLQLHGPDEDIPFEFTGRINFEWSFEFEGNKYRWSREVYGKDYICSLDRKPDPKVEICLAREASSKGPARLQILHYNIERFPDEIKDLRGLETLLVTSLVCLLDAADDRGGPSRTSSGGKITKDAPSASTKESPVPPVPARPERVISEDDFEPENPNEIMVSMTSNIDDHIARAINLLEDTHVLFIVIRTRIAEASQRALEVSLGVTRFRHREGMADLKQYVIEEEVFVPPRPVSSNGRRPGPKVIKLDDEPPQPVQVQRQPSSGGKRWTPPPNIAIYLSTIELPDLKPGRRETLRASSKGQSNSNSNSLTPGGIGGGRPITQSPLPTSARASPQPGPGLAPPPNLPPKDLASVSPPNSGSGPGSASGSGSGSSKMASSFGKLFRRTSS
ncbi:hypothetical protein I316_07246 [Kwoniella heveanensis BCC8398]|uniref:Uncharacterized protein n=1 Tax=Kwoniella heveanensis BCC8398 TaxID=1296120 RepID=A0A1B9GJ49_9TREE|nr:hypothetical protein I316_07246 [Kwoniella heveanensis BCC8398]